jgi:LL-diaminopimelate aminotransferase
MVLQRKFLREHCFKRGCENKMFEVADRVKRLPPYLFAEIETTVKEKKAQGVDLISLSIGDPDLPPPPFIITALKEEVANLKNHNYSLSQGEPDFREAVAAWCKKRFRVDVSQDEVIALLGSKEGLANIARAFVNAGDHVLVPDPSYPVYNNGSTILNDGVPVPMLLLQENGFKPDLEAVHPEKVKMMFLNYPNNPTSATVDKKFLKQVVEFARENNIILCYDNAYSEVTFDGYRAPSILEIDGAMDVAIEFHSCSKTFNMTGDRIAFAVGNKQLISGLAKVKSQIDSGPPVYIQKVAAKALASYKSAEPPHFLKKNNKIYAERRDVLVDRLRSMGFRCDKPKATFYVWLNCKSSSIEFATKLLSVGVAVTPGVGFGEHGENYVRFSLTQPKERIVEASKRIAALFECR